MNCPRCGAQLAPNGFCQQCNALTVQVAAPAGQPVPVAKNPMAITGFVLSLVGLFCFPFILELLAIIFSILGLVKCNQNPNLPHKGLAIAGLIIGIVGFILGIACSALYLAFLGL